MMISIIILILLARSGRIKSDGKWDSGNWFSVRWNWSELVLNNIEPLKYKVSIEDLSLLSLETVIESLIECIDQRFTQYTH